MEVIDDYLFKRREKLKVYCRNLSKIKGIHFISNFDVSNIDQYGPLALWIVLDNKYYDRNKVILGAMNIGIPIGSFNYNTIIKNAYFKKYIINKYDDFENSQYIRDNSIFLPLYESLSIEDIQKISDAFKYVINNYGKKIDIFDESVYDEKISYFDGFYLMRR